MTSSWRYEKFTIVRKWYKEQLLRRGMCWQTSFRSKIVFDLNIIIQKIQIQFKKCLLTHNTWYSNLNNRPQCVIKIKETDKRRKKAGRWHISRYIKYISRKTENERISISGSTLNQVWHIWVSLQLNNYASQRGLETLMGLCAPCMLQRY